MKKQIIELIAKVNKNNLELESKLDLCNKLDHKAEKFIVCTIIEQNAIFIHELNTILESGKR